MLNMKSILFSVFIFLMIAVNAQPVFESQLTKKMDLGVELMEQGKYEQANETFVYVLNNMTSLPSDMAFYFGQNSFHIGKLKQSINWLNKYIQLKGTQGRHYEEATKFLQLAEDKYLEQSRKRNQELKNNIMSGEYDCGGLEKMICPVCKGQGVVVTKGPFENIYKTCPYSAGEAYLTCEEYNLFMSGLLEPKAKK